MIAMRQRHTTVGHIFGATFRNMHVLCIIHGAHDTHGRRETKTNNSWSHGWGNFQTHAFVRHGTHCT